MKKFIEYVDQMAQIKGFKKDSEIAKFLNITTATMSRIRHGSGVRKDKANIIAEATKTPKEEIYLASQVAQVQDPEEKKVWENIAKKLSNVAAALLICVSFAFQDMGLKTADAGIKQY